MDGRIPLSFTPQQLDYIAGALGARPWVEVQALLTDMRQQVEMHNAEAAQPKTGQAGLPDIEPIGPTVQ